MTVQNFLKLARVKCTKSERPATIVIMAEGSGKLLDFEVMDYCPDQLGMMMVYAEPSKKSAPLGVTADDLLREPEGGRGQNKKPRPKIAALTRANNRK